MKTLPFAQIEKLTDDEAREILEAIRWPNGPVCPHCQTDRPYQLKPREGAKSHANPGTYKCRACRKQFTVTVGTVMHQSHIKLTNWLMGIYLMCSSKKGISAHQLHRTLGMAYDSAWFMSHRIRLAMSQMPLDKLMDGEVELDATYMGGSEKWKHADKRIERSSGGASKTPVFALVERGGQLRARRMRAVTNLTIRSEVRKYVSRNAILMTDESPSYKTVYKEYLYRKVNHSARQYVKGDCHVNTLEGWFSLLKRGVSGTFHHVSEEHLDRYVNEFVFRYNLRDISDAQRAVKALEQIGGKRLMYKEAIYKPSLPKD